VQGRRDLRGQGRTGGTVSWQRGSLRGLLLCIFCACMLHATVSFSFSCSLLCRLRTEGLKSISISYRAVKRPYDREAPDSMWAECKGARNGASASHLQLEIFPCRSSQCCQDAERRGAISRARAGFFFLTRLPFGVYAVASRMKPVSIESPLFSVGLQDCRRSVPV